ncbi:cytochrome o ubiquinol oxidase subunit I [Gammaproteobacteria bacterium ESL0073]|uniref:Cytochrome bo(3) ubiquinol oxidase subunit 1 n=1 Tax=Entomomonas moraniae TaxID=2213226 RepID=A0A3S9XGI7_9GAMM|nr:cytochrome o ubiquinol oxidase subunit I [Entomomonas moraniae]AWM78945.1 cytochrome o ubiquinol oxidase subunit I [Gammaproteobacteria bacterium ESL0073]AZS51426.1 cytochrome o ubiquinol oxidase subunit I [Entomomonas moraniae]
MSGFTSGNLDSYNNLTGYLSWKAVPTDEPIVMWTVGVVLVLGVLVLGLITFMGWWKPLWKDWITSVDHKKIGIMYIVVAILMLVRGFADALLMRTHLALASAEGYTAGHPSGYLPPDHYNQIFTAHGVIMIFFMATPLLFGLMNILLPQQIGARDVAFPFLNNFGFWLTVAGVIVCNISLGVGDFATGGWLAYAPETGIEMSPTVGMNYYLWSLQLSGIATTIGAVNFIVTILKMRAPGMTLMHMPIFTWTCLCTNILAACVFPILTVAYALLTLDRYFDFNFFTNHMGGNAKMYINLVWAWGHPEVYFLVLPAFGIYSEIVPVFSGKPLFGYKTMVYATVSIVVLSLLVWGHHFFTMGAGGNVNAFFGIMTMIIAIPTGVKVFNWIFTMYEGRVRFTAPMYWVIGALVTFTIGGMTGVMLAVPPIDFVVHNSLFLVAHFHNTIIGGVVYGYLAGLVFWFPKMFGFKMHEGTGKASFWCWLVGFYLSFMPLYALGFMGLTRRMSQFQSTEYAPYFFVAMIGTFFILFGVIFLVLSLLIGILQRNQTRDLTGDAWGDGRSLEWSLASPPAPYNFAVIPKIYGKDAFFMLKEKGEAYKRPEKYEAIHMPKNTGAGFVIGMLCAVWAFALVWHIWWLAIVGFGLSVITYIVHAFDDDRDYYISAEEVERIENERFENLAKAGIKS